MRVTERPDGHYVTAKDGTLVGPFRTNADAWDWIDRHSDEGRDDSDRYNRIRIAFGEYWRDDYPRGAPSR